MVHDHSVIDLLRTRAGRETLHRHYQPGRRSDGWRKHPLIRTTEVIVCSYRPGQGRIAGRMGGLALGAHDPDTGDLVYIGDVGLLTGLAEWW